MEDDLQLEDNLKILKVEYISNNWSDLSQILNFSSGDQTKMKNTWNEEDLQWKTNSNGRRPQNIKSWIYQQPMILLQILNLSSGDQTKIKDAWNEDDQGWKKT